MIGELIKARCDLYVANNGHKYYIHKEQMCLVLYVNEVWTYTNLIVLFNSEIVSIVLYRSLNQVTQDIFERTI